MAFLSSLNRPVFLNLAKISLGAMKQGSCSVLVSSAPPAPSLPASPCDKRLHPLRACPPHPVIEVPTRSEPARLTL